MDALIKKAIDNCGGVESDWRLVGEGVVHKDVVDVGSAKILGPAILRGGVFLGGEFRGGMFLGGEFRGGVFWSGAFHGGVFRGGSFWGGVFWSGSFWSGVFFGGEFLGGDFRGGEFHAGKFLGGAFHGGDFRGGEFRGGEFYGGVFPGGVYPGGVWTRSPIFMTGSRHTANEAGGGYIVIGCERHSVAWWLENVRACAEENNYTPDQIDEYQDIVEFMAKRIKAVGVIKKE